MNSTSVLLIQIVGDWIYLFDAYLYHDCWLRDAEDVKSQAVRASLNQFLADRMDRDKTSEANK